MVLAEGISIHAANPYYESGRADVGTLGLSNRIS